jgi:hypothetical protein
MITVKGSGKKWKGMGCCCPLSSDRGSKLVYFGERKTEEMLPFRAHSRRDAKDKAKATEAEINATEAEPSETEEVQAKKSKVSHGFTVDRSQSCKHIECLGAEVRVQAASCQFSW